MHLWLIWGWEEESAVLSMKLFNSKTLIEISALFLLLANGCLLDSYNILSKIIKGKNRPIILGFPDKWVLKATCVPTIKWSLDWSIAHKVQPELNTTQQYLGEMGAVPVWVRFIRTHHHCLNLDHNNTKQNIILKAWLALWDLNYALHIILPYLWANKANSLWFDNVLYINWP